MHFKTNLLPLLEIIRAITPATIRAVALLMLLAMGAVHAHEGRLGQVRMSLGDLVGHAVKDQSVQTGIKQDDLQIILRVF